MIEHGECPYPDCSGPIVKTTLNNGRTYLCYACSRRPDTVSDEWEQPDHNPFKSSTGQPYTLADRLHSMSTQEVNEVFSD